MRKVTLEEVHKIHLAGDLKQAEQLYNNMLNAHTDNWLLLFFLGTLYLQLDKHGLAITLFERAGGLKPSMAELWNNLGTCYKREHNNEKARKALFRALSIKDDVDAYNNLGTLHVNEGSPEQGEKYLRKALELDPKHLQAHWNLALTLLEQGKWTEGFREYSYGLQSKDRMNKSYDCGWWNGEKGKKVVVYGEQGIGDEIMFASMIPDLKKRAKVIMDCHPRLIGLFERSFNVKCYPTRKEVSEWHWEEPVDAKIPIGNLGKFFRRQDKDFPGIPYLKPDPEKVKVMRSRLEQLGPGPYIGISWEGGKKKTRNDLRSVKLEDLRPILQQNITPISLQYTKVEDEIAALKEKHGIDLPHWGDILYATDYDETAALVTALDLVISVNTSVVHLAGALGQACWVMTPIKRAWRYVPPKNGNMRMIWYNSVRQYHQLNVNQWSDVIEQIANDVKLLDGFNNHVQSLNTKKVAHG